MDGRIHVGSVSANWVLYGPWYTGERGDVEDEFDPVHDAYADVGIGEIGEMEIDLSLYVHQILASPRGEIVHYSNGVSFFQEAANDVGSNEARTSSDKHIHL